MRGEELFKVEFTTVEKLEYLEKNSTLAVATIGYAE